MGAWLHWCTTFTVAALMHGGARGQDVNAYFRDGYDGRFFTVGVRGNVIEIKMNMDRDLLLSDESDMPISTEDVRTVFARAETGDMEARYKKALLYLAGQGGVERSYSQALDLFSDGATRGHAASRNALGALNLRGQGVVQNMREGESWIRLAGGSMAAFNLGYLCFWQLNVSPPQSPELHLVRAARDGYGIAEHYLGLYYVMERKYSTAYEWLLRASARRYDARYSRDAKKVRDFLRDGVLTKREAEAVQDAARRSYIRDLPPPPVSVIPSTAAK